MMFTELETKMIANIVKNEFRSDYLVENDPVWVFSVVENNIQKGVISSLIKKDIVKVYNWDDDKVVEFTPNGLNIAMKMFPGE